MLGWGLFDARLSGIHESFRGTLQMQGVIRSCAATLSLRGTRVAASDVECMCFFMQEWSMVVGEHATD